MPANHLKENSALFSRAERRERPLPFELAHFIVKAKRWWLAPTLIFLLILGAIVFFGGSSGVAPLIYAIF